MQKKRQNDNRITATTIIIIIHPTHRARRALLKTDRDLPPAPQGPLHDAAHPPDVPGHLDHGVPGDDDSWGWERDAEADGEFRVFDAGCEFTLFFLHALDVDGSVLLLRDFEDSFWLILWFLEDVRSVLMLLRFSGYEMSVCGQIIGTLSSHLKPRILSTLDFDL